MSVTMQTPGLLDAILERTVRPQPDCLIFIGATDRGYGRVQVDGTAKRAHRVVWELTHGPIPDGLTIEHLCKIRACLNVEHMELLPHGENSRRSRNLGPLPWNDRPAAVLNHTDPSRCRNGHARTPENTRLLPSGRRECLECRRLRTRKR